MYFDENNNYFDMELDSDIYNIDNFIDKDINKNINIGNIVFNRHNDSVTNPVEGFNRGNLFNNLYNKYKNHSYTLKVNNKRDELLYKIQVHNFAIKDLTLYLDIHPNEIDKLELFKKYKDELLKLKAEYSRMYSPLDICDVNNIQSFTWINNPWPWDKGGNK